LRDLVALAGIAFFIAAGARDLWMHPADPKKAKEYGFLLYAMLVATAYGVAHDHITATLSPDYFLRWKGLSDDPRPFRWAVTVLAARASLGPGVLAGTTLLVANHPRRSGVPAPLPYAALLRLSLVPLAAAATTATVAGLANSILQFGSATAADLLVPPDRIHACAIVWAVHAGSYAGAFLGTIASAVLVVRRRHGNITRSTHRDSVLDGGGIARHEDLPKEERP